MDAPNNYYAYPAETSREQSVRMFFVTNGYLGCSINKETHVCTCMRQKEIIECSKCGTTFLGRRRIQCSVHPATIHLMDLVSCSKCGAAL